MDTKILIIGACGQIGTELTQKLRSIYGNDAVIASDIRAPASGISELAPFEILDASNKEAILKVVQKHHVCFRCRSCWAYAQRFKPKSSRSLSYSHWFLSPWAEFTSALYKSIRDLCRFSTD